MSMRIASVRLKLRGTGLCVRENGLTIATNGRQRHQRLSPVCQEEKRFIALSKRTRSKEYTVRQSVIT